MIVIDDGGILDRLRAQIKVLKAALAGANGVIERMWDLPDTGFPALMGAIRARNEIRAILDDRMHVYNGLAFASLEGKCRRVFPAHERDADDE
jgi:hypothetical protein